MAGGADKAMAGMTERQKKWFATVQANFEAQTGKPMADWLEILKACPETTPGKKTAWLKAHHGVGVNHAAYILSCADGSGEPGWDDPEGLRSQLWKDADSEAILARLEVLAKTVDGVVIGQRKAFTSFSRAVQFAAARPMKGGGALIGFKLEPDVSARLSPLSRRESWSERLTAVVEVTAPDQIDAEIERLFRAAAERG